MNRRIPIIARDDARRQRTVLVIQNRRSTINQSMPEIKQISDSSLGRKVVDVWAQALAESSFKELVDVPGENWVDPAVSQVDHQRAVAKMALAVADAVEEIVPSVKFNRDVLIAGALVHDVGKAFEYDPARTARWRARPQAVGQPSIRHPVYGVHLALRAGLPEPVVHIVAAHAGEGTLVRRSLENTLIAAVDLLFWDLLAKARTGLTFGELEKQTVAAEVSRLSARTRTRRRRRTR